MRTSGTFRKNYKFCLKLFTKSNLIMPRNLKLFLIISLAFSPVFLMAQTFMRGVCGVHAHEMELMEQLYPNDYKGNVNGERNAIIHVPVQFHLVATDGGTGRLPLPFVLKQMCRLNRDYSNTNIRFYLYDDFKYINNTKVYSTPATQGNTLQSMKVSKAVNVYVTDKADPDGALGTVLGYYSSQGDYIVLTKNEAAKQSNTLSHEMGHFFSLRHTFHGWESDPWNEANYGDTILIKYTLSGTEIEYVRRTNCETAADQLCDTPPDYNFGFTSNGCNYNYEVWDYYYDPVEPQKENQMSYFNDCDDYLFTPNQGNRMLINYNSSGRNYLKNQPAPKLDTVTGPVTLLHPTQGQQLNVYDGVLFDWEDVPNATHYILEIRNLSANEYLVVEKSEYYATNLRKNLQYTYEVTPFSFGHFCAASQSATFKTGNLSVTATEVIDADIKISLYPNPVATGMPVALQVDHGEKQEIKCSVSDLQGRKVYVDTKVFDAGKNHILIPTQGWNTGMYVVQIQINNKIRAFKVSVL